MLATLAAIAIFSTKLNWVFSIGHRLSMKTYSSYYVELA